MYTIGNDQLTVTIAAKGAEPQSVVHQGLERLWQADPTVWPKHAPLLFPLIGRLRDGQYVLDGQPVDAPKHGFCRERAFDVVQQDATSVTFATQEDDETLVCFPFRFRLEVEYRVQDNTLIKTHRITNKDTRRMPFELGGHEAYATCLLPGETMADYYVQLGHLRQLEFFDMDAEGMLGLPKRTVDLQDGRLTQTPEQLGIDTVVLEDVPGRLAVLASTTNDHTVTVDMGDFPYLGIWTMPAGENTRYLCIEPWSALPDGHFMPRELGEKPGVISVQPGLTVQLSYSMTFA